jgi:hypothetical protein
LNEGHEKGDAGVADGLQGGHFLDACGKGGVEGIESPKDGARCDECCRDPGHDFDGLVKNAELFVVAVFPDGGELEIVSLEGEELDIVDVSVAIRRKSHRDGGEGVALGEGGQVIAVKSDFGFQHGAGGGEAAGNFHVGIAELERLSDRKIILVDPKFSMGEVTNHGFAGAGEVTF